MWEVLPWVNMCKSCYRGQREGKTEEYKITNTKNCHNNASKQKEPAIRSKYIITTKETICFNPHKNLPSRFILLTTMSCSEAVLGAGCSAPASHQLVVVVQENNNSIGASYFVCVPTENIIRTLDSTWILSVQQVHVHMTFFAFEEVLLNFTLWSYFSKL